MLKYHTNSFLTIKKNHENTQTFVTVQIARQMVVRHSGTYSSTNTENTGSIDEIGREPTPDRLTWQRVKKIEHQEWKKKKSDERMEFDLILLLLSYFRGFFS